jgi:hypothetical protein
MSSNDKGGSEMGTEGVTIFIPDMAEDLRSAADAIRRGQLQETTAEWRDRLAGACERAAALVAPGTGKARENHR